MEEEDKETNEEERHHQKSLSCQEGNQLVESSAS